MRRPGNIGCKEGQFRVAGRVVAWVVALFLLAAALGPNAGAVDPPHHIPNGINCINCHTPHSAPGGAITGVEGNPNLCMSCHNPTGPGAAKTLNDADQAVPGQRGTSHRWDSGPSGHVEPALGNTSTGRLRSGGSFTGRIEESFTITITAAGDVGTASFEWTDSEGFGGGGTSGAAVPLSDGLLLGFQDGSAAPSFVLGDSWTLFVRTDLRLPSFADAFERPMAQRLADTVKISPGNFDVTFSKVVCSVCHDQHSQARLPFDPAAPPFGGSGTGAGRHFQRQDNNDNQMCKVCHSARDVQSADLGSHPVAVTLPAGDFQAPPALPLDAQQEVECLTCHAPHFTTSGGANGGLGDGYLLRLGLGDLCFDCHTLADRAGGSHFDPQTGALWPGGQYGSSFPAHSADKRGFCVNCHWPHGWPDDTTPADDYARLWVERYDVSAAGGDPDDAEDLCFTCHDGTPAGTDIRGEFAKGVNGAEIFHHPVADSEQSAGRSVECVDCHNPHLARADNKLAEVTGVDLAGSAVGPGTGNPRQAEQHEVCFKCHGDSFNNTRPGTSNKRLDFQTTNGAFHPVAGPGRNQSLNLRNQLLGGLNTASTVLCTDCHNSEATADVLGPASGSAQGPQGPHGATNGAIRRANYPTGLLGPADWNRDTFALCFLCHDPQRLVEARRFDDGAATNFYDDVRGRDNLHWVHLLDRSDKSLATCKNCHFNVHSNVSAANTQYNVDGVISSTPPTHVKTHLVSFSPDIVPIGGRARPEWWIDTATRERRCYLSCHGTDMDGPPYRPDNGGDDTPTIP
jgi:predicted CXXCH cytochrome family protein